MLFLKEKTAKTSNLNDNVNWDWICVQAESHDDNGAYTRLCIQNKQGTEWCPAYSLLLIIVGCLLFVPDYRVCAELIVVRLWRGVWSNCLLVLCVVEARIVKLALGLHGEPLDARNYVFCLFHRFTF